MKRRVNYEVFSKVDLRIGTIIKVEDFPKARKLAYLLHIDFGPLGLRKTSAQITVLYTKEALLGRQIMAIVNFPQKQIANIMSQCLVTGAVEGEKVFLLHPETKVPNGTSVS
jgi:tRNA-binding protein